MSVGIFWKRSRIVPFCPSSVSSITLSIALASFPKPLVIAVNSEMKGSRGPCPAWLKLASPFFRC